VPTDRRFTGQREETGLGLYDYAARRYDPLLGRFIQADTIVPSPQSPQSLNRYMYVSGNPLRHTDPTGHFSKDEIMQYLGVDNWDQLLAFFEQGGQLEGWWGWLAVLRTAELGWTVWMWSDASQILQQPADISIRFMERAGKLLLGYDSPGGYSEIGPLFAAQMVRSDGAYSVGGNYFGAGEKVLYPTYDPSRVDWTGIALDTAGIVADLLTLGMGGELVNAAQARSAGGVLGKATDLGGILWDWGPTAVDTTTEGFRFDAGTLGLCLDVAGMVSPVPIWADATSIVVGLTEGYRREP